MKFLPLQREPQWGAVPALAIAALSGCTPRLHLNEMQNSLTISDLKARAPFSARVLDTVIDENFGVTNAENQQVLVTNLFSVTIREANGKEETISEANVCPGFIAAVRRLEHGKTYRFPQALSELWRKQDEQLSGIEVWPVSVLTGDTVH